MWMAHRQKATGEQYVMRHINPSAKVRLIPGDFMSQTARFAVKSK
jgi:hypothetical protein